MSASLVQNENDFQASLLLTFVVVYELKADSYYTPKPDRVWMKGRAAEKLFSIKRAREGNELSTERDERCA